MFSWEAMVDITRQIKLSIMLRPDECAPSYHYVPTLNEVQLAVHWDLDYNMSEEGGDGHRLMRPSYYDYDYDL